MASSQEEKQLIRYEALVQQKSELWDTERLSELYYDRGSKAIKSEECLNMFLCDNQVLFSEEHVDFCQLVIHLNRCGILSNSEKRHYTSSMSVDSNAMSMRFNHFTQRLKDSTKIPSCDVVSDLYIALRNTYEESTGGKSDNHYFLAKSLRKIVLKLLNLRENEQNTAAMISLVNSDVYDVQKGISLMKELGITFDSPEKHTYKTISQLWMRDVTKNHSLDVLVCALIRSGLGKLSMFLQPRCKSNPPIVLKLLRQLPRPEEHWIDLAHFLGYADDDPEIVAVRSVDAPAVRLQMFLRFCRIPDCGESTSKIVMCLKESSLFGGFPKQIFHQKSEDVPQDQSVVPHNSKSQTSSKQNAAVVTEQPAKPAAVQQYSYNQDEGVKFLDNCICDHWREVDAMLRLSTTKLPPELIDQEGKTAFLIACTKTSVDIQRITKMINRGANLLHMDNSGFCVLHYKSVLCNRELLELLLNSFQRRQLSIDIHTQDNAFTPLMMACMVGNETSQSVELLLKYGASPNGSCEAFSCPLIEATEGGNIVVVELLIQFKAHVNRQDDDGNTALLKACQTHRWNIARLLINSPGININKSNSSGTTPLFASISENSYEIAELLLKEGADPNRVRTSTVVQQTPLAHACTQGFLDIVKLLLFYRANVNFKCSDNVPAIGFAIISKQNFIVKYLLDNCSELDTSIYALMTPICISVSSENFECTKLMLDKLGGLDRCIQLASSNGLMQLDQHLRTYAAFLESASGVDSSHLKSTPIESCPTNEDNQENQIILQEFCELCIKAVHDKSAHNSGMSFSVLATVAEAMAAPKTAKFFWQCACNSEDVQTLKDDFLTTENDMSALTFLIRHGALTHDDFMKSSSQHFSNEAELWPFYNSLVVAFCSIPGNENLPQDPLQMLDGLFSNKYIFKYINRSEKSPGSDCRLEAVQSESSLSDYPLVLTSDDQQLYFDTWACMDGIHMLKSTLQPPEIIQHPQHQSVICGENITLEISTIGSGLSYSWSKDGIEISDENYPKCSGINTKCLRIEDFKQESIGKYVCVVSNSAGRVKSSSADLTLARPLTPELQTSPQCIRSTRDSFDTQTSEERTFDKSISHDSGVNSSIGSTKELSKQKQSPGGDCPKHEFEASVDHPACLLQSRSVSFETQTSDDHHFDKSISHESGFTDSGIYSIKSSIEITKTSKQSSADSETLEVQTQLGFSAHLCQSKDATSESQCCEEQHFQKSVSEESGHDSITSGAGSMQIIERGKVAHHSKLSPEKQLKHIQEKYSMESITQSSVRSITKCLTDKLGKYHCLNEPPHGSTQSAPTDSPSTDTK